MKVISIALLISILFNKLDAWDYELNRYLGPTNYVDSKTDAYITKESSEHTQKKESWSKLNFHEIIRISVSKNPEMEYE